MQIQGAINSMLNAAAAGAYAVRRGITVPAQREKEKMALAEENLKARQEAIRAQQANVKKRRTAYEDVKSLQFGDGRTLGELKLTNAQYKDIRKQVFGTTRSTHGQAKK